MEQQQIHSVPLVSEAQSLLPSDEGEISAELQQEMLQMLNQRLFEFVLRVLIFQTQELQHERITNLLVRRELIARL